MYEKTDCNDFVFAPFVKVGQTSILGRHVFVFIPYFRRISKKTSHVSMSKIQGPGLSRDFGRKPTESIERLGFHLLISGNRNLDDLHVCIFIC